MPNHFQNEAEKSCNLFDFYDIIYLEQLIKEVIPMVLEIDFCCFPDPGTDASKKAR